MHKRKPVPAGALQPGIIKHLANFVREAGGGEWLLEEMAIGF
jgi:hypothetical protein